MPSGKEHSAEFVGICENNERRGGVREVSFVWLLWEIVPLVCDNTVDRIQLKFVEFDVSRFLVERGVIVGWFWRRMCEK